MRIVLLLIMITFFGCKGNITSKANRNLHGISEELSGDLLGKVTPYQTKEIKDLNNDIVIFASHKNLILKELSIHFKLHCSQRFKDIQNFYNNMLGKTEKDSTYCSWQTDSTEFILYKNSDSSILVNIFKRN